MAGPEPLVLVSLSTLYQDGQARTLQAILDALAGLALRALVTTGPSVDPAGLRAPANVEVRALAPHAELMPRASLVVGHWGHATTMAALSHDLPLLLFPMLAQGDQPVIARLLAARGAALTLAKDIPPARIREAVQALLGNSAYRASAASLGALIRRRDGAQEAADQLAELLPA